MRIARCRGFTLVELLVVVTIIGILVALLLPAVQGARESARSTQCGNNLKQLGLGCLEHEAKLGFLPTGGWGWRWAGDPDRGFARKQPGGWHYNVLPFVEQENLHQMGSGGDMAAGRDRAGTPLAIFNCPSRRPSVSYPFVVGSDYINIDQPAVVARSDYAGNGGQKPGTTNWAGGPGSLSQGDSWTNAQWSGQGGTIDNSTGVFCRHANVKIAHILDGKSNTYLLGEKFLSPEHYDQQTTWIHWDDQSWDVGYDWDVIRLTTKHYNCEPRRDQDSGGYWGWGAGFGSPHAAGFHMVLCDGSVHRFYYGIDPEVHYRLGNRKDAKPVDWSKL